MIKYRAGSSSLMQFSFISLFLCNLILILIHSKQTLRLKYAADPASAVRSACWQYCPKTAETQTTFKNQYPSETGLVVPCDINCTTQTSSINGHLVCKKSLLPQVVLRNNLLLL